MIIWNRTISSSIKNAKVISKQYKTKMILLEISKIYNKLKDYCKIKKTMTLKLMKKFKNNNSIVLIQINKTWI